MADTGTYLRASQGNAYLLAHSTTPIDDRHLFDAHPLIAMAHAAWVTTPLGTSQMSVTVYQFHTRADAPAVDDQWSYQEQAGIEGLDRVHSALTVSHPARQGVDDMCRSTEPASMARQAAGKRWA